ncbi:hypothetical protein F5H01DRAFT_347260 [Linnemannia elongata]|nr:hypothetical protein F5H01DRAFT_347260 [Linnemannia elongata]
MPSIRWSRPLPAIITRFLRGASSANPDSINSSTPSEMLLQYMGNWSLLQSSHGKLSSAKSIAFSSLSRSSR